MALKIENTEHFAEVSAFAVNAGPQAQAALQAGLARLKAMAGDQEVELHYDFAPNSFAFVVRSGNDRPLIGGLIYSGPAQHLDGSSPTFTVSVDSPTNDHKWSVHT